ncbi:MAG: poly(A) polymerase [Betaproteobacteria bacterium RIFCSPLOWO2_02_FULL_67_19]|nr:MAG: poly(A) polymerase [Betaproteobacteria bacterium RIFCSPLOWO2_02_FULL_67_19]
MIKRFIRRVLGLGQKGPLRLARDKHHVSRDQLSPGARKVCEVLAAHGHAAYVVGGAVRDLLLRLPPKDFDIATDARPEQVKPLFRRALLIGRRFRIVHVMIGAETVEVSTFRAALPETETEGTQSRVQDEHGRVLRDNVFGTLEEDARRRDFTINALYFEPATEEVIDYHGGLADLKKRTMRIIGDPETRYREDPIRMLRAVRLGAKLGLSIDAATRAPIKRLATLLESVPPARLFDEMLKLLLSGHASACVRQLRDEGLHKGLLPLLDVILDQPLGERFVTLALAQTDARVLAGKPVSPAFLFAALLWHEVLSAWRAREKRGERSLLALEAAMDEVLDLQCEKLAITRKLTATMREVWAMQPRFEQRSGQRAYRLLEAPRFRMGYDFLALRAASGEVPADLEAWWRAFQSADAETRQAMLLPDTGTPKRRRRRRRKKTAAPAEPAA